VTPAPAEALKLYRDMVLIRTSEERFQREMQRKQLHGTGHLYAGEEAVAVGVCAHLDSSDYITNDHRGHGHCIAKGVDVRGMMAELFGKSTGSCKGKGGSMHIADAVEGGIELVGENELLDLGAVRLNVVPRLWDGCQKKEAEARGSWKPLGPP
jgi:pyruvate dehydrogenase E1 component alpha subunit